MMISQILVTSFLALTIFVSASWAVDAPNTCEPANVIKLEFSKWKTNVTKEKSPKKLLGYFKQIRIPFLSTLEKSKSISIKGIDRFTSTLSSSDTKYEIIQVRAEFPSETDSVSVQVDNEENFEKFFGIIILRPLPSGDYCFVSSDLSQNIQNTAECSLRTSPYSFSFVNLTDPKKKVIQIDKWNGSCDSSRTNSETKSVQYWELQGNSLKQIFEATLSGSYMGGPGQESGDEKGTVTLVGKEWPKKINYQHTKEACDPEGNNSADDDAESHCHDETKNEIWVYENGEYKKQAPPKATKTPPQRKTN